jgi:CRP-like cAMP-binding protein
VGLLGPGQHFGEYSVLLAEARTATVVALDCCELYALSRPDLARVGGVGWVGG